MAGELVRSLAGHDKGRVFCVTGADGPWLYLVDGKRRKLAAPKRKKKLHAEALGGFEHPALARLSQGETVSDNEIRRALAAFRARQGGYDACQKTT